MKHADCVENCLRCYEICFHTAMTHCLSQGGKHTEPQHFQLMMNCAKICETSASFQLSGSEFSADLCELCEDICLACAKSCEEIGGMDECVSACLACADSCRAMAAQLIVV
ncbi:MAG: four-helix bundle copper-binding protein [Gammaproteobacteria bacterium]|nr:MAG: four-helix bundle copper-binding protein [Gammaproteobacteria bacterium]